MGAGYPCWGVHRRAAYSRVCRCCWAYGGFPVDQKNIGPSSNPGGNHRVRRGANDARAAGAAEVPNLMAGSQADMRSTFIATGPPVQSEWEPAH
jgi:hypothetical protein